MKALLIPNTIYHVYNHAVGSDNLFRHPDDYIRFLTTLPYYTRYFCDVHAYCLMPNHMHVLIRVCSRTELMHRAMHEHTERLKRIDRTRFLSDEDVSRFLSVSLGRAFSSHAQYINHRYERMGNLFISNFKRKPVTDDTYYKNVVKYIHRNPVNHGFTSAMSDWAYSSYLSLRFMPEDQRNHSDVMTNFGGYASFVQSHEDAISGTDFHPDFKNEPRRKKDDSEENNE
jgi:REP element-mobilizing transposase RayT